MLEGTGRKTVWLCGKTGGESVGDKVSVRAKPYLGPLGNGGVQIWEGIEIHGWGGQEEAVCWVQVCGHGIEHPASCPVGLLLSSL